MGGPLATVKAALKAYVDKDRGAIERLIAEDYSFTSPIDNGLDRQSYFARCWPNSEVLVEMTFVAGGEAGETAWVVYEAATERKRSTSSCMPYELAGSSGRRSTSAGICPTPARPGGFVRMTERAAPQCEFFPIRLARALRSTLAKEPTCFAASILQPATRSPPIPN